jgi:hypothetical protein
MGDRAVIGFRASSTSGTPMWLYTHWTGSRRYDHVKEALEKSRSRWNDPSYATRIAISAIVGDDWNQELGYGLTAGDDGFCMPDYSDVPVICWQDRLVLILNVDADFSSPLASMDFADTLSSTGQVLVGKLRW